MNKFKVGDRVSLIPLSEIPTIEMAEGQEILRQRLEERLGPQPWVVIGVYATGIYANEPCVALGDGSTRYFSWRFKLAEPTQMELF